MCEEPECARYSMCVLRRFSFVFIVFIFDFSLIVVAFTTAAADAPTVAVVVSLCVSVWCFYCRSLFSANISL